MWYYRYLVKKKLSTNLALAVEQLNHLCVWITRLDPNSVFEKKAWSLLKGQLPRQAAAKELCFDRMPKSSLARAQWRAQLNMARGGECKCWSHKCQISTAITWASGHNVTAILFSSFSILENNKLSFWHDMCPWLFGSFPVPVGPRENAGPSSTFVEFDGYHQTVFLLQKPN